MNRYDLSSVRDDFPILSRKIYDKYPLVYLDNAATTQKPRAVVEAMTEEYYNVNANVHRGVHFLSQRATDLHEGARETVRRFLGAASTEEIVFTRGTTESINLVATSMARLHSDDPAREVIVSALEHHSNIVSWQLAGFRLRVIPMSDDGELDLEALEGLFTEHTCLVSVTHVSNVLGVETPVERIIQTAHTHGVPVLVDGAQSAPHRRIDVEALDCDFFALSGHKMYGPTGIGVLYGKRAWLQQLPPYMGGGEMIRNVSFERLQVRSRHARLRRLDGTGARHRVYGRSGPGNHTHPRRGPHAVCRRTSLGNRRDAHLGPASGTSPARRRLLPSRSDSPP